MEENTQNNNSSSSEELNVSPYNEGAVTGSAEDVLKGRDVSITSTDTQKLTVPTHEEVDAAEEEGKEKEEGKPAEDKPTKEEGAGGEDAELQVEVDKTNSAARDLKADLTAKGIDFDAMAEEFLNTGDFSQQNREALAKAGYPETVVDAFISGLQATAERIVNTVYSYCGGEAEFNKLTQFVQAQGDGSIEQFNRIVETGDLGQIKLALDGFKARMGKRTGIAGRSVLGGNGSGSKQSGFTSKSEMVKAMSDPRYGRDPSYTKEIQKKTMNSSFF